MDNSLVPVPIRSDEWLQTELGIKNVPDSPDHATKWVVGFLKNQESLTRLVELHKSIPRLALKRSIPRLLSAFDEVQATAVKQEWQKAIDRSTLFGTGRSRPRKSAV